MGSRAFNNKTWVIWIIDHAITRPRAENCVRTVPYITNVVVVSSLFVPRGVNLIYSKHRKLATKRSNAMLPVHVFAPRCDKTLDVLRDDSAGWENTAVFGSHCTQVVYPTTTIVMGERITVTPLGYEQLRAPGISSVPPDVTIK